MGRTMRRSVIGALIVGLLVAAIMPVGAQTKQLKGGLFAANDHAGMENCATSDLDLRIENHIWVEDTLLAQDATIADHHSCMKNTTPADSGMRPDRNQRADIHRVVHVSTRSNYSRRMSQTHGGAAWLQQRGSPGKIKLGFFGNNCI